MEIILLPKAQEHLHYWKKSNNKALLKRIATLIKAITDEPYSGVGKPELLKYELAGKWSRRIDKENRIVYAVQDNCLYIYALKGHY
jgi:toxin YoeB